MKQMVTDTSRNSGAINDHTKDARPCTYDKHSSVSYSLDPFTLL